MPESFDELQERDLMVNELAYSSIEQIAIIGMSGRFPGAKNLEQFWQNLRGGIESVSILTDEELAASGIDSAVLSEPGYVKTGAVLEDIELFDASFFDFNPREAETTDPQHRLFLECAWEALERAGYDSQRCESRIGVYAGASLNNYLSVDLTHDLMGSAQCYQRLIGNDKDFLTTRVSYKLNLKGPSVTVQTACSTSLVATILACQSLLNYQCDMALAGGVSVKVPQKTGYLYEEGGTLSPDGHCRAFDAKAQGTTIGNGVGVVVLKRLSDAIADGDCIDAVIRGSSVNNDGSLKVGYTAPSLNGQAEVIAEAMMLAGVEPETVSYIEAHGTGTTLGDPIEVAALSKAFHASTEKKGFCAIGSLKTNIGHLDAAAGIAGLIKTVLALKHKQIPPSLNFEQPNPEINFVDSPFYVHTKLSEWKTNNTSRRAGVSSLGMGGTNAHVILEEAPTLPASSASRPWQLLLLSAKTDSALERATQQLAEYLTQHPELNLADVAHTLQVGRREFNHRRMLVCCDIADAVSVLKGQDAQRVFTHFQEPCSRSLTFMFPGQGSQYVNMGKELYQTESVFREQVDRCCELLRPQLGLDLRLLIYPGEAEAEAAAEKLRQTDITQPALFVIEYALAQLWISWGISPQTMIGHSIGEYVAATLAGVMSVEDALVLVATRGRLMQQLPPGAMLAVSLPEADLKALLDGNLFLAASNSPTSCVVSGVQEAVASFQDRLLAQEISCRRLHTSHAFHSPMMVPILEPFGEAVKRVKLHPPKIPFISNVTGTWITTEQAMDPSYWVKHLLQTVQFAAGISRLLQDPNRILLEVGPGRTLYTFAKQQTEDVVFPSLRHSKDKQSDAALLLNTLGRLWLTGVAVDWSGFYAQERRYRLPLPTYPFERQRYWISSRQQSSPLAGSKKPNVADWFYVPVWKQALAPVSVQSEELAAKKSQWLIFADPCTVGSQIAKHLERDGHDVITVVPGEQFSKCKPKEYTINPQHPDDYDTLIQQLQAFGRVPDVITHLWSITLSEETRSGIEFFDSAQILGFYSLLFLVQALGQQDVNRPTKILVVTNDIYDITGVEQLTPEKATVLGLCRVIPQEYPQITCRGIDVTLPVSGTSQKNKFFIDQLIAELHANCSDSLVAYRGHHRWIQTFEPIRLQQTAGISRLREEGAYLITGGLGGIGLELAEYLAQTVQAKLILLSRSILPPKEEWKQWLATHDEQEPVSRKIQKVQFLEELGAEVLTFSADAGDEAQMQVAIAQAFEHFGQIHGVIHAAGLKLFGTIQEISKTECDKQLQANGHGLFVLEKVLQGTELDFCLLISSLASVIGALGMAAYPAAHLFADAFVHKHNQTSSVPWISVNWDNWLTHELSAQLATRPEVSTELFMTSQEGVEVFQRVLSLDSVSHIVTSTVELQARIDKWIKHESSTHLDPSNLVNSPSLHSRPGLQNAYAAPSNELEKTLAGIWQEVLGIEQVGIHDNFFELGGDSLLSIQITARANKAGLRLTNQYLFEYPTIAQLAEVVGKAQTVLAEQGLVQGEFPLTPIQQWFFEQDLPDPHYWNQAVLLELRQALEPGLLEQVVQQLLVHHDALRLQFVPEESGWKQVNAGPHPVVPFSRVDLSAISPESQEQAAVVAATELQASLNLSSGPIMRVALFERGGDQPGRLLIVVHHLAVDVGSWRILLDDLQTAYQQLRQGQAIKLPLKTTSFKQWAERLIKYAQSIELEREQVYWLAAPREWVSPLPVDYPQDANTVASARTVSITLGFEETQTLLQEVTTAYRAQMDEVLLAALVQALVRWTGMRSLLVDLEANGRAVVFDEIDLSRTVGWFTTLAPILLEVGETSSPGEVLKQVKEHFRSFPNQGLGYGTLRYLCDDTLIAEKLHSLQKAEIVFLYLGQLEQTLTEPDLFELSAESSGLTRSLQGQRSHLLEVDGVIEQGRLKVDWTYSENVHRRDTVEKLAQDFVAVLRSFITACQSSSIENYTPSDFAEFRSSQWTQEELDKVLAAINSSEAFEA